MKVLFHKKDDQLFQTGLIFIIFVSTNYPHMMNNTPNEARKEYQAPALRFVETALEYSFLQSNLEPIGGGNDPDNDW